MLPWIEILIRLSLAALFGALIGLERERRDWAAGLRTHMMVCVGSCLIMIVSAYGFADVLGTAHVVLDPSRIAAQVVSGIGFIGAGTILFLRKGIVRGLTTAAGLWTVAAIGLATGGGLYFSASATTVIALIILWAIKPLERMYVKKFKGRKLKIVTSLNENNSDLIKNLFEKADLEIQTFTLEKSKDKLIFQLELESHKSKKLGEIMDELKNDPTIKKVSWSQ